MVIDAVSYNKAMKHPQRWGYQLRGGARPSSIIIHTTNNRRKGTSFAKEAAFLLDSNAVSAHFLVGKSGQIVQFLAPDKYQAWHSGEALPAYQNARSIGIEHHVSVGEAWTDAQRAACTWLVRKLMADFQIPPRLVDTHRAVALPARRKSDPEGWDNESFYAWRNTLVAPVSLPSAQITPQSFLIWEPRATQAQCVRYILSRPHGEYTEGDVRSIVASYFAQAAGIDPLLAIAQMIHETGGLTSWWAARPRRNPAGLGVTGESVSVEMHDTYPARYPDREWIRGADGLWKRGLVFASWDLAARAHIGRLLAYALPEQARTPAQRLLVSYALALRPLPFRGVAPTLAGLDGRWAVAAGYSQKVAAIANAIRGVKV